MGRDINKIFRKFIQKFYILLVFQHICREIQQKLRIMITIPQVVEKIVSAQPFLAEALVEGLINVSSLARKIQNQRNDQNCNGRPNSQLALPRNIHVFRHG